MERRIESDVEGWPTRPFEDGFEGLRQLAAADFSGVVRAGGAWLFFVNGKIVGVFEGSLEDVDGAQGTAHKAPHPSLPLLYAMQTKGGDTRAKYYTNETPISEVDGTLSSGGFTGYVELSENVLSGDYYQLYHGGRSMSVAFVGNSGRMITGDEAFERADDEVGIYEVVDVDVQVTEVPSPDGADSDDGGTVEAGAGETGTEEAASSDPRSGTDASGQPTSGDASAATAGTSAPNDGADEPRTEPEEAEPTPAAETAATVASEDDAEDDIGDDAPIEAGPAPDAATAETSPGEEDTPGTDDGRRPSRNRDANEATTSGPGSSPQSAGTGESAGATNSTGATESAGTSQSTGTSQSASTRESEASTAEGASTRSTDATGGVSQEASTSRSSSGRRESGSTASQDGPQRSEAAWREATTVPSLDPDNSDEGPSGAQSRSESGTQRRSRSAQESPQQASARSGNTSADRSRSRSSDGQSAGTRSEVDDTFDEEVLEREDRLDSLQQRVENLQDERDDIAEERDELAERVESLTEENESLRSEVRELEAELEELEASAGTGDAGGAAGGADAPGGGPMSPRAALEGTDLFVRYDSKGQPTLEGAHGGSADAGAVNENLRLDVHTQFEDAGVTVDGEPFEAFLEETMAFRFVEWLVRKLPYEIRETGSEGELRDLYDAIPEIDRVEFHGEVARDAMDEEEGAPSETFDVVVRDKMGEALLVANMNDARDPATGRMIVDLQEAASRVKEHSMALSGAFFVTRSFFEPEALETTSEATSGSLLSRDSRASYVKLSRKQGYHLCLVEARGEDLHLNVPEL